MPLDGLTMGFLAREMQALTGGRIDRVSQPEKDMVVLLIRAEGKNRRLLISASPSMTRIHLTDEVYQNPPDAPMFCMLLRKYLIGGRVVSVEQLFGDRLIRIVIDNRDELGEEGPRELYLEAMGRHSNLTLVKNGQIIDAIRHVSGDMSRVRQLLPGLPYELPPRQDKLAPEEVTKEALFARLSIQPGRLQKALQGAVSGLSPVSAAEITLRLTGFTDPSVEETDLPAFCAAAERFFTGLSAMGPAVLCTDEAGQKMDYFPFLYFSRPPERQTPASSLSRAMDLFYSGRDREDRMAQKGASLKKQVKTLLERSEKKLTLQQEALDEARDADRLRLSGELLSAQLYRVPKGAKKVLLENYYDEAGGNVEIPLDETLTPVQNAQKYFKRYRKAMAARKLAAEQKEKTLAEIDLLEESLLSLQNAETPEDLSDVRRVLEEADLLKKERGQRKAKKPPESRPLCFAASDGTEIFCGKNSVQNERLTKNADGSDLWLHAKNMPGSHVIVRLEGKEISEQTLLEAARIAAFYSKGHGVAVPVDYCLRKYVKKPAGTPTGFVIYTHQKTLTINAGLSDLVKQKK